MKALMDSTRTVTARDVGHVMLTQRERLVLHFLSYGYTEQKIADTLNIQYHTVRWHNKNIKWKLQSKTNSQSVAVGFQQGLLT